MNNKPEVQVKAQFDAISEKQIRKNFQSFAKLIMQISELEELSQDFVEELKDCTGCLGIIIINNSEEYADLRGPDLVKELREKE